MFCERRAGIKVRAWGRRKGRGALTGERRPLGLGPVEVGSRAERIEGVEG